MGLTFPGKRANICRFLAAHNYRMACMRFLPVLALLACVAFGAAKPNIIWIMVDDLGYGDLGCYGQKQVKTPHLDRLAAEGLRFTDFYSGHTVCRPSRLVLWTGKHSGQTPIASNANYQFKPEDVTVAELAKEAGYVTGGVGKWALGGIDTSGHPNANGFDMWMGYLDQGRAHNFYPEYLWRNRDKVPLAGNVEMTLENTDTSKMDERKKAMIARARCSKERKTFSHDVMTDAALDFIRDNAKSPFMLHVHWTIPHANNEGGFIFGDGMEVPDYGIYADRDWPTPEKGFAAMVTRMDKDVGRLTALLRELELAEKTLVFFTSDNGPHSEGNHKQEFFDSNGPTRGYKRDLYEGGIRVPGIAWWPGRIQPGRVSNALMASWDYLPTVCELAGIRPPPGINGISMLPTLLGKGKQEVHSYLFWRSGEQRQQRIAVRAGKWKLVRPKTSGPSELYDLEADIGEQHNLATKFPEVLAKLERYAEDAVRKQN
jgi:arylsulfatase A-like enzyme